MQQELIVDMLERASQYDPSRGSAGTFTGLVSEHRAAELMDRLIKDRSRTVLGYGDVASNDDEFDAGHGSQAENAVPMWADDQDLFGDSETLLDLQTAMAHMDEAQTLLFQLLCDHQDLPSAAKASGMSSATFYRRVTDLQMHLRMFGI